MRSGEQSVFPAWVDERGKDIRSETSSLPKIIHLLELLERLAGQRHFGKKRRDDEPECSLYSLPERSALASWRI